MQEDDGLMFMRARFYDPVTKRFMGKDLVKGQMMDPTSLNPYMYQKPILYYLSILQVWYTGNALAGECSR